MTLKKCTPTVLLVPGDPAPPLQSQAVLRGEVVDLTLDEALQGVDFLLLVFYPADFTFVCPTEIVQFTEKFAEFAQQQCNVVCCSTDSVYTHLAWLKSPKSERGLGAPDSGSIVLLSDRSHEISRAYGVLAASGAAYRGTFLIDKSKTICQVTINDMPVGRSVDDALRMLKELRCAQSGGEPAKVVGAHQVNSSNAGPSGELADKSHQGHHLSRADREHQQKQRRHQRQQYQQQMTLRPAVHHLQSSTPSVDSSVAVSEDTRLAQAAPGRYQQPQPDVQQQQRTLDPAGSAAARAAQLETRAAQLRLQDSENRLARLLADADRLRTAADRQLADTQKLKAAARRKQSELAQLLVLAGSRAPTTAGDAAAGDDDDATPVVAAKASAIAANSRTPPGSRLVLPPPLYHHQEPPVQY